MALDQIKQPALRALGSEEAMLDEALREKVRMSLVDARPSVPAKDVFARLRACHEERVKAEDHGP